MEAFILKSNLALVIFYFIYRLVVYPKSNHQFKRFVGIMIVIFCTGFLLIPSMSLKPSKDFPIDVKEIMQVSDTISPVLNVEVPQDQLSTFMIFYIIGGLFLLARFLYGIRGLIQLYKRSEKGKKWGFNLVQTSNPISPFSFFNYLFIQKGFEADPESEPIVLHEQLHRDQLHSVDVILLEILAVFYWFNPIIWLIKKDIKASHEFHADEFVINNGFDKLTYQDLLFKARTGVSFKTANYLSNQTSLKQRFNIMEKRNAHLSNSLIAAGIVLVAMALTVIISSFSPIAGQKVDGQPIVKIFTASGEVDLKEGISTETEKLFIRMIPEEGDDLAYRITEVEVTLVTGGLGQGTVKSGAAVEVSNILSKVKDKSALVIEVKEYQSKDKDDVVETFNIPRFINLPIN